MNSRSIGPFRIDRQLGQGGMGRVYLATHVESGRQVALKVLRSAAAGNPDTLRRFEREISILRKLEHRRIVRYYGCTVSGPLRCYVMEYVAGGTLAGLLRERGPLPWQEAATYCADVCDALAYAHAQGIVHRDLKPGNLFFSPRGRIKLGDFGVARDEHAEALTAAGRTVGSFSYMAPEQINGRHPVSGRTDLYALGCVLFELLAGRPPFLGANGGELLVRHLKDSPPRLSEFLPDLPAELETLVDRLLAKNPADRPTDASEVRAALARLAGGPAVGGRHEEETARATDAPPPDVPSPDALGSIDLSVSSPPPGPHRFRFAAMVLGSLVVVSLVVLLAAGLFGWAGD